jgi:small subunit ribosomal protein S18
VPKTKVRGKNRDNSRRAKKKVSFLTTEGITYVDWKNDKLLRKFMSERAKIRARRVTGNNAQQQKLVADAIKLAREMALVPYSNRVTTQRQNKDRDGRSRAAGPMPRPSAPPPAGTSPEEMDGAMEAEEELVDVGEVMATGMEEDQE